MPQATMKSPAEWQRPSHGSMHACECNCFFSWIHLSTYHAVHFPFSPLVRLRAQWQEHVHLRGPISGETDYVIVWFSHCHSLESVLWKLKRRDCETPSHWIHPGSQLAAKSNNYSDLTPYSYCIASRLTTDSLCASMNVSVCVCFLVGLHARYLCIWIEGCFSMLGVHVIHNLAIQSYCQKMRKRANPGYGIDVKQDRVDPCVTEAISWQLVHYPAPHSLSTSITV